MKKRYLLLTGLTFLVTPTVGFADSQGSSQTQAVTGFVEGKPLPKAPEKTPGQLTPDEATNLGTKGHDVTNVTPAPVARPTLPDTGDLNNNFITHLALGSALTLVITSGLLVLQKRKTNHFN